MGRIDLPLIQRIGLYILREPFSFLILFGGVLMLGNLASEVSNQINAIVRLGECRVVGVQMFVSRCIEASNTDQSFQLVDLKHLQNLGAGE
jgi:hypothetical protein